MSAPVLYVAEPPPYVPASPRPMVVDCSALAGVLFQEPWMDQALQRLSGHRLYAPHLLQAEICSVAVKKARRGAAEAAAEGLAQWQNVAVELTDFDVQQTFAIAQRYQLSAYDASYLWLRRSVALPAGDLRFETRRRRPHRAPRRAGVHRKKATAMFDAVLFDCDGVLVDSEPITNGVLRQNAQTKPAGRSRRPSASASSSARRVRDERVRIEAETGKPLTEDWMRAFYARRNQRLMAELQAVAGALDAVIARTQPHLRPASPAPRAQTGPRSSDARSAWPAWRRTSKTASSADNDQPRSKPHPDVYLAAAAHLGVNPARCLVIEDTASGVQAGLAAGATVWGYCQHGDGRAFQGLPVARVMHHMGELAQHLGALR